MEAALRIHQRKIDAKKVHLVKDLPRDLVAEVYAGEMLQVISNLVVNALDALPASGTLCVRIRRQHDKVRFLIADNGHGIPQSMRKRFFSPSSPPKRNVAPGWDWRSQRRSWSGMRE